MNKQERIKLLAKSREEEDKLFNNSFIRCRQENVTINCVDELICKYINKKLGKRKKIHCIYKSDIAGAKNIVYYIEWEKDILHGLLYPISKKEYNELTIKYGVKLMLGQFCREQIGKSIVLLKNKNV